MFSTIKSVPRDYVT